MRIVCTLAFLLLATQNAFAKDLGTYGETHQIAEQDFEQYIIAQLNTLGEEKLINHQKKIANKIVSNIKRPNPVKGIARAAKNNTRYFDPTFTLEQDLYGLNNELIFAKGTKVNPLEHREFTETWLFIDGDDEDQRKFAENYNQDSPFKKIILVKGSPGQQKNGSFYYFDQFGELSKKLSISKVPCVLKQAKDKKIIEIQEVALNEAGS